MQTDPTSERKKQRITFLSLALIIIVLLSLSGYFFLFSTPAVKASSCAPGSNPTSDPSTQQDDLLSGFAVTCLEITSRQNGSVVLDGLVYVANSGAQQEQGFQNVTGFGSCNGLAAGTVQCVGMIFNFTSPQDLCFWMHNTKIQLQQDWIASNGSVVYEYQATPENDFTVCHFGVQVLETLPSVSIPLGSLVIFDQNKSG